MAPNKDEINQVKVADSTLLYSTEVFVPTGTKDTKNKWIRNHALYLGDTELGERIVTPVCILGDMKKTPLWMDAITGSLYTPKGNCLSSSNLHLSNVRVEKDLDIRLKKVSTEDAGRKVKVRGIGDKK
jgi:hypothetical protein